MVEWVQKEKVGFCVSDDCFCFAVVKEELLEVRVCPFRERRQSNGADTDLFVSLQHCQVDKVGFACNTHGLPSIWTTGVR